MIDLLSTEFKNTPVHTEGSDAPRGAHFLGSIITLAGWVDMYRRKMPSGQLCYHAYMGDKLVSITAQQFEKMRALPLNQVAVLLWFCWRRDSLQ